MKPIVKKVLAGIAVVSALASVVAGREKPTVVEPQPVARIDTRLQVADDLDLAKLENRVDEGAKVDAFAPRNFSPIVPAREAHARPARPEAPPLPFRYIGKMLDGDKLSVFIANGGESFAVAAGDRIGDYRIESVTEAEIRFTYLPLKTKQSLPL
ncbi:MAG TPA: hypothetical protein VIV54_18965 [Burkholderiales bacterium]